MKKVMICVAMFFAASAAMATTGNNGNGNGGCGVGQQTNGCGSIDPVPTNTGNVGGSGGSASALANGGLGGAGGLGGMGGSATGGQALGGAAVALGGSANGGMSTASSAGGAGGSSGGNIITVSGNGNEAAASTAYAPDGKAPRTSCRLFVGFGGSVVAGGLSGGVPIGNDQTCMSGAQIEAMDKANKVQPGTFGVTDYLVAICAMEGMDKMRGCAK